jgi:DNA-binding NarL/FixJ family response regulator
MMPQSSRNEIGRPSPTDQVRVAIVNDYEVIVAGVLSMLAPFCHRVEVVELAVQEHPKCDVDVALFDAYGQPELGVGRIRSLAQDGNVGSVAVYTWTLTKAGRESAFRAGARGLIAKSLPAAAVVEALHALADGRMVETDGFRGGMQGAWPGSQWRLSSRESEVLALLATGMPNQAIADALYVSENTVRTHLKAVFRKLSVTNRSQAVARALSDPSFAIRQSNPSTPTRSVYSPAVTGAEKQSNSSSPTRSA